MVLIRFRIYLMRISMDRLKVCVSVFVLFIFREKISLFAMVVNGVLGSRVCVMFVEGVVWVGGVVLASSGFYIYFVLKYRFYFFKKESRREGISVVG